MAGCRVDASFSVSGSVAISAVEDASFSLPGLFTGTLECDGGTMPPPSFGPTCTASAPPPPISGGTVLVTRDGQTAVVCDPDRDAVYVVSLPTLTVTFTIRLLQPGDEPGRARPNGAGRVHVALRAGGAVVTIDPGTGVVTERRSVCPAPRGVAWDATRDVVWVACATGELVALPSAGGAATTSWVLDRDRRRTSS